MLQAEIHGKYDVAVRDNEDYLTSTVFGHLRYVRPGPFWSALFSKAKALPHLEMEESLNEVVGDDHAISRYEALDVLFWPKCPGLGEPELAMVFRGGSQRPLVVLVEVKLWAGKSGYGEHDQLMRYLRIADSIQGLTPAVPLDAKIVVAYLTPRDSTTEVSESLAVYGNPDANRHRLFRLQWQDIIDAISEALRQEGAVEKMILEDVRQFLRARGLEYFRGFACPKDIDSLHNGCGWFYVQGGRFEGFHSVTDLSSVQIVKGEW